VNIVLLHSGVTDAGEWDAMKPLLEPHDVVAPTWWGARGGRFGDVALAAIEDDSAALVGTSHGGRAALDAALAEPARVSHVVLIGTNPFGWSDDLRPIMQEEGELFDDGRLEDAAALMARWWLVGPKREPADVPEELQARVRAMQLRAYDLGEPPAPAHGDVTALGVPLLYLYGELDWPDVARAGERFAASGATVQMIEGVAHLPALERPDEVARLVQEFLA
jgi:pimeloyl-ACP methyl ester carboxylesterase